MKTTVTKIFRFEAAHQLSHHTGKCARLHGHSYVLEITVSGAIVQDGSSVGMIVDFSDLTTLVNKELIDQWDHQFLNDLYDFPTTVELLAQEAFLKLKKRLPGLQKVRLWETSKAFATIEL